MRKDAPARPIHDPERTQALAANPEFRAAEVNGLIRQIKAEGKHISGDAAWQEARRRRPDLFPNS